MKVRWLTAFGGRDGGGSCEEHTGDLNVTDNLQFSWWLGVHVIIPSLFAKGTHYSYTCMHNKFHSFKFTQLHILAYMTYVTIKRFKMQ